MLPIIIEQVNPKKDDFLRLRREEMWIRAYQSVEFGANSHSWKLSFTRIRTDIDLEETMMVKHHCIMLLLTGHWFQESLITKFTLIWFFYWFPDEHSLHVFLKSKISHHHTGNLPPQTCSGSKKFPIISRNLPTKLNYNKFGFKYPVCQKHFQ